MESENKDNVNDFDLPDSNDCTSIFGKPSPYPPTTKPPTPIKFIDLEKYVEEMCENKIKILDRSTFHHIKRPIVISFNYLREKWAYQTEYFDVIYQLALKYGDRIEFIIADPMDIDVIYPGSNPITFFYYCPEPLRENLYTYVIDERKRIHSHYDAHQTVETISEVCEQLLNGSLFPSQPIPERNDSLVKVCVHQNYDDLVTHSTKDVLLIVGQGEYTTYGEYQPDYEFIAQLKDSDVDVVYIDKDKNFIPFHLNAHRNPTMLFLPLNHKDNFIHFSCRGNTTQGILYFIQENTDALAEISRQKELSKTIFNPSLPLDIEIKFEDLEEYLDANLFSNNIKILTKEIHRINGCVIIHFMKFKEKGVTFYLETLKTIHQVAEVKYPYKVKYFVADIEDVHKMYPTWYKKYLQEPQKHSDSPKVYGVDKMDFTFEVEEFKTASSLFFFSHDLYFYGYFRSQSLLVSELSEKEAVKSLVGDNYYKIIHSEKSPY